jgi:hypothetical protein
MQLGLTTMTNNQGSRLEEWVTYHSNLGHTKFIIFLDNCSDNSETVLKKMIDIGIDIDIYKTQDFGPEVMSLYWIQRSHVMYDFVLEKYSYLDWITFIEVDEFIFPQTKETNLPTFLKSIDSKCLYINSWDFKPPFDENKKILGQSNYVWTDSQRYNSIYRFRGKSIIKPCEFSKCMDAHHFMQKNNLVSKEFKVEHVNYLQKNYGCEVVIDDYLFKIYHFRNHTDIKMGDYVKIDY